MKRISVLIAMLCIGLAVFAWSGARTYEKKYTIQWTGISGSTDSTKHDTIYGIVPANYFSNQYRGIVILDSIPNNAQGATGFGIRDTVDLVLKGYYAGRYVTMDSVRKVQPTVSFCTLLVDDGIIWDSLSGERLDLIIRINDSLNTGPTTDSTVSVKVIYKILHKFRD